MASSLYLPAPTRTDGSGGRSVSVSNSMMDGGNMKTGNGKMMNRTKSNGTVSKGEGWKAPSYEERCRAAAELARARAANKSNQSKSKDGSGKKTGSLFVPRSIADFDDGGAFPEIHVAQYPKHLGNPNKHKRRLGNGNSNANSNDNSNANNANAHTRNRGLVSGGQENVRQVTIRNGNENEEDGSRSRKDYTALVRSGTNSDKVVYATHNSLKPHTPSQEDIAVPSEEEVSSTASRTAKAIQSLISSKVAMAKPSGSALLNAATSKDQHEKTQFIKYTPNPDAPGYNPAAAKRIVQMVPAQLDPMMPPKHKHLKAPRGPAEDPVPVLHAPPAKLTKEERQAWDVPACISNWKNTRGYTIPLDKRLAADGRGLRDDTTINSNFATLSESLYLAERQAREEVKIRALVQKRQAQSIREKREQDLRDLAFKARMERSGLHLNAHDANQDHQDHHDNDTISQPSHNNDTHNSNDTHNNNDTHNDNNNNNNNDNKDDFAPTHHDQPQQPHTIPDDEQVAAQQRDKLRLARRKERERELRMERHSKGKHNLQNEDHDENDNVTIKKARLEDDRDVSEKIALGVHTGTGTSDAGVDGRLYNQSAGLDSGFGPEDEYNTYSKPMFDRDGVSSSSIYRPTRGEAAMDADQQYDQLLKGSTNKFQPDKGFAGAEGAAASKSTSAARNAPVQFEKAT